MYVHVEHYIDDSDLEDWLSEDGLSLDDAHHDYSLISEYLEIRGGSGEIVKIL